MIRPIQLTVACVAVMVAHAGQLNAGVILSPVSGSPSTNLNNVGSFGAIFDRSGLSTTFNSGTTDFDAYLALSPTHGDSTDGWQSVNDFDVAEDNFLDFDLGEIYEINQIAFWGADSLKASVINFNLFTSNNGVFGAVPSQSNSFSPVSADVNSQVMASTADTDIGETARYIRLDITSISGSVAPIEIGEIAFDVTAVPEPSSMAILGLGACYFAARRRRRGKRQ